MLAAGLGTKCSSAPAPCFFKHMAKLGKRQSAAPGSSGHAWPLGHCATPLPLGQEQNVSAKSR